MTNRVLRHEARSCLIARLASKPTIGVSVVLANRRKRSRNDVSFGDVQSRAVRDELGGHRVLARRERSAFSSRYGRLEFAMQDVDFWAPYEIDESDREMVLWCTGREGASVTATVYYDRRVRRAHLSR